MLTITVLIQTSSSSDVPLIITGYRFVTVTQNSVTHQYYIGDVMPTSLITLAKNENYKKALPKLRCCVLGLTSLVRHLKPRVLPWTSFSLFICPDYGPQLFSCGYTITSGSKNFVTN